MHLVQKSCESFQPLSGRVSAIYLEQLRRRINFQQKKKDLNEISERTVLNGDRDSGIHRKLGADSQDPFFFSWPYSSTHSPLETRYFHARNFKLHFDYTQRQRILKPASQIGLALLEKFGLEFYEWKFLSKKKKTAELNSKLLNPRWAQLSQKTREFDRNPFSTTPRNRLFKFKTGRLPIPPHSFKIFIREKWQKHKWLKRALFEKKTKQKKSYITYHY